jgi:hypothetical protein
MKSSSESTDTPFAGRDQGRYFLLGLPFPWMPDGVPDEVP